MILTPEEEYRGDDTDAESNTRGDDKVGEL
jgi:hypothetical protein